MPIVIYGGALLFWAASAQTHVDEGVQHLIWLQNAGFIWVPFIVAWPRSPSGSAWTTSPRSGHLRRAGDDHSAQARLAESWLYTGTFGSFIGLAVAFPTLLATPCSRTVDHSSYAFIGPLLAALMRPLGGWLADRLDGAAITFWNFAVMAVACWRRSAILPDGGGGGNATGFCSCS